jgi:hypothetical protein
MTLTAQSLRSLTTLYNMDHDNPHISVLDLLIIWVGTVVGNITLSTLVLLTTLLYTVLKIYLLIRDNFWRKKE